MTALATKAVERYGNGYNCAQAVASVFWEKYELPSPLGMRILQGMGGGFRAGEICGAASGAVMIIGLETDDADRVGKNTIAFMERFSALRGATTCRDILQATPAQRAVKTDAEKAADKKLCDSVVAGAVEILEDMGY